MAITVIKIITLTTISVIKVTMIMTNKGDEIQTVLGVMVIK